MGDKSKKSSMYVKPLMYIHQPGVQTVEIKAQSMYRLGKEEKREVEANKDMVSQESSQQQEVVGEMIYQNDVEKILEVVSSKENLDEDEETEPTRKPFKEMTVEEKIHYVLHRPTYIPTPLCEIVVEDDAVVGYVAKEQDGYIFIRLTTSVEMRVIEVKEIRDIRLMMW